MHFLLAFIKKVIFHSFLDISHFDFWYQALRLFHQLALEFINLLRYLQCFVLKVKLPADHFNIRKPIFYSTTAVIRWPLTWLHFTTYTSKDRVVSRMTQIRVAWTITEILNVEHSPTCYNLMRLKNSHTATLIPRGLVRLFEYTEYQGRLFYWMKNFLKNYLLTLVTRENGIALMTPPDPLESVTTKIDLVFLVSMANGVIYNATSPFE